MANLAIADCAGASRIQAIASLNDDLRKTGTGGTVMLTQNLRNIPGFDPVALQSALTGFEEFNADNDPHGEHDFGGLTLWGCDLIWKIDYYNPTLTGGSEDPADTCKTQRVLTVMLASDW